MRIGDLSRRTGVDIQTVRYYEKAGLLPTPSREANGYRAFGPAHLERLAFIRHCRALDITLADVKRLLRFVTSPDDECGDVNRLIDEQLARVRARLASMRALEKQLGALRAQCDTSRAARRCGILGELIAAAHGEACACHDPPVGSRARSPRTGRAPGGHRLSRPTAGERAGRAPKRPFGKR